MHWGEIVPALIVGAFAGWLYGISKGHADTQTTIEQQAKKIVDLLAIMHRDQQTRVHDMDVIVDAALAVTPTEKDEARMLWHKKRRELRRDQEASEAEFSERRHG